MGETELHAGLIAIVPNVTPITQRELFDRALQEISGLSDMINKVVEVGLDGVRVYELPRLE